MRLMVWLFFLAAVFTFLPAEEKTSLVRINLNDEQLVRDLQARGADITFFDRQTGALDVLLTAAEQQALSVRGIAVEPLIADIDAYAQQLRESDYLSRFHNPAQILNELQQAARDYPYIAALHDIGDSYFMQRGKGGHDVWALKISDDVAVDDSTEADVLLMANIHAREIITPEIILYTMRHLLENYGRDPYVTHLVNNREIWLIPTANPDGLDYVFSGDAEGRGGFSYRNPLWWRKNKHDNDESGDFSPFSDGVDLNRNFGHQWGLDDLGSSPNFGDFTYRGVAPFSEPESQVIRDFVRRHRFVISLCYHSYSNLWLYPWGYTFEPLPEPALSVFKELADSCVVFNGYKAQPAADLYTVNGDTDDWLWAEAGIYAFTPEVGHPSFDGFFPDTSRIMPLILENLGPNLFMIDAAGEEPRIECGKVDQIVAQQPTPIRAVIRPPITLTDSVALDPDALTLYYRHEQTETFARARLVHEQGNDYSAEIPAGLPSGVVYFYAEAQDLRGRRGVWPRGAPLAVDSFFVKIPVYVDDKDAPQTAALMSNYPNPFNSTTIIEFTLPIDGPASITIYDVNGRAVKTPALGHLAQGRHQFEWNGSDEANRPVSSGVYYCRLAAEGWSRTIKLLLIK